MQVRPAHNADLPRVVELIDQMWQAHGEDDYDQTSLTARCREIMATCTCYMIERDGRAIAFASLQDQGDYMLIRHFTLEETLRGAGVGRAAFAALEAHAFPGRKSRLYASIEVPGPRAFWERMGYRAFAYTMERKPEIAA